MQYQLIPMIFLDMRFFPPAVKNIFQIRTTFHYNFAFQRLQSSSFQLLLSFDGEEIFSQIFEEDIDHSKFIGGSSVILYWKDDGVKPLVFFAEHCDLLYDGLEGDSFVKMDVFESVGYNGSISVVVHINLQAFNSVWEILDVSFNFGVWEKLVAWHEGVVGWVYEVIGEGQVAVGFGDDGEVVPFFGDEVGAEMVEGKRGGYLLHPFLYYWVGLVLLLL